MSDRSHRFTYAADIEWRPGGDDGIHYARFPMDDANPSAPTIILAKFDPGVRVQRIPTTATISNTSSKVNRRSASRPFGKATSAWSRVAPATALSWLGPMGARC